MIIQANDFRVPEDATVDLNKWAITVKAAIVSAPLNLTQRTSDNRTFPNVNHLLLIPHSIE